MSKLKPRYNEIIFSDEQEQDIINRYLNKQSSTTIGKVYGVNHHAILKVLHAHNVKVDGNKIKRKYALNEEYFDKIDTPNKAYVFGFLCADGHVSNKKCTISMCLQEGDKDILEEIRHEVGSEKPLEYVDNTKKHDFGYTYQNQWRLLFFSNHMCKAFNSYGIKNDKSYTLEYPEIPKELNRHFIRGYFDGNGTISLGKNSVRIVITSTSMFLREVDKILKSELDIHYSIIREASCKNGVTFDLRLNRTREAFMFLKWMYDNADMKLKRKYDKYLSINNTRIA